MMSRTEGMGGGENFDYDGPTVLVWIRLAPHEGTHIPRRFGSNFISPGTNTLGAFKGREHTVHI